MPRRLRRPIIALWAGLLAISTGAAQESALPFERVEPLPVEPEPVHQWLEEVRAQRLAREERRRATKEAIDARRRWIDPWGAAQKEIREREQQRRRNAFMEHIERDRETFRNQVPWGVKQGPWQDDTIASPVQPLPSAKTEADPLTAQEVAPTTSSYSLPGWDNRWYYRGY